MLLGSLLDALGVPAPTGTLITPETLCGCLGPTPECCSHSNSTENKSYRYVLMESKENSVLGQARRSMARTLGEVFSFPLSGTGNAAMARQGLLSSRVIGRSRRVEWRVTQGIPQGIGEVGRAGWGNWGYWAEWGISLHLLKIGSSTSQAARFCQTGQGPQVWTGCYEKLPLQKMVLTWERGGRVPFLG